MRFNLFECPPLGLGHANKVRHGYTSRETRCRVWRKSVSLPTPAQTAWADRRRQFFAAGGTVTSVAAGRNYPPAVIVRIDFIEVHYAPLLLAFPARDVAVGNSRIAAEVPFNTVPSQLGSQFRGFNRLRENRFGKRTKTAALITTDVML